MYMWDERPSPRSASEPATATAANANTEEINNLTQRSQNMQTDQSYLKERWRPDREDFEQESNNVSAETSQTVIPKENPTPSQPSQTDTNFLKEQGQTTQDSPSQTVLKPNPNDMGNIRYPTHYVRNANPTSNSNSRCFCGRPCVCSSKSMPTISESGRTVPTSCSQESDVWFSLDSDSSTRISPAPQKPTYAVFCPNRNRSDDQPNVQPIQSKLTCSAVSTLKKSSCQSSRGRSGVYAPLDLDSDSTCRGVKSTQSTRSLPCSGQSKADPCVTVVYCPMHTTGPSEVDIELGLDSELFTDGTKETNQPTARSEKSEKSCACASGRSQKNPPSKSSTCSRAIQKYPTAMTMTSLQSDKGCPCASNNDNNSFNTEPTTSCSRSVMAKVTCLCSSEQRALLGESALEGDHGPPFVRIEESNIDSDIAGADPYLISTVNSESDGKEKPNYKATNTSTQGLKVVFLPAQGYCDCQSTSNTSITNNATQKSKSSSCICSKVFSGFDDSQPENTSVNNGMGCFCSKDDYKSACSEQTFCSCAIKTSKYDQSFKDFCSEPESVGCVMRCDTVACADRETLDNLSEICVSAASTRSRNSARDRLLNMVDLVTRPNDSTVNRGDVAHEIIRELTVMLRQVHEEEETSKAPKLSYEDCMEAVSKGERPVKPKAKSEDEVNRLQCLDRMEQYLQACSPTKKATRQEMEIIAFEIDPDFNPFRKSPSIDEQEYQDSQLFASCYADDDQFEGSCHCEDNDPEPALPDEYPDPLDPEPEPEPPSQASASPRPSSRISVAPEAPIESIAETEPSESQAKVQSEIPCAKIVTQGHKRALWELDPKDPLSPLTDRERLLCEHLLRRMCELCGEEETNDDREDRPSPNQPCLCCHCRALVCDNKCKTVSKVLDSAMHDPVAEMKFFIDSVVFDLQAMDHVLNKNQINPKSPKPSPCMGNAPGESFPVTITDVSSLGCRALYVRWELQDCSGVGGYEIYVDGHLTNRFYSHRHEAGVVSNVDVSKRHQIILRAQVVGQEFPGEERDKSCNAVINAHPEMLVGAQQPWTPSVYFYEP